MTKEAKPPNSEQFSRLDWRITGKGEIACKISPGLFSSERTIILNFEETSFGFWINEDSVETDSELHDREEISGFVRVSVKQEKEDSLIVVVSGEPVGNHGTHIEIPKNLIRGIKIPKSLIHPA